MHYRVKRNRLRKGVPNMYKNYVLTVVLVVLEVRVCGWRSSNHSHHMHVLMQTPCWRNISGASEHGTIALGSP
jgi:hypothetical protein